MLKRLLIGLLVTIVSVSCQPVIGTLTVSEPLRLQVIEYVQSNDPWCHKGADSDCREPERVDRTGSFEPGRYKARLRVGRQDVLRLSVDQGENRMAVIELTQPKQTVIPSHNGEFALRAAQSGQPYDLTGLVRTEFEVSPVFAGWETCRFESPYYVCYGHGAQRRCGYEYVTHYGRRHVEFHHEHETKVVTLDLLAASTATALARFEGAATVSDKVYDYLGYCQY